MSSVLTLNSQASATGTSSQMSSAPSKPQISQSQMDVAQRQGDDEVSLAPGIIGHACNSSNVEDDAVAGRKTNPGLVQESGDTALSLSPPSSPEVGGVRLQPSPGQISPGLSVQNRRCSLQIGESGSTNDDSKGCNSRSVTPPPMRLPKPDDAAHRRRRSHESKPQPSDTPATSSNPIPVERQVGQQSISDMPRGDGGPQKPTLTCESELPANEFFSLQPVRLPSFDFNKLGREYIETLVHITYTPKTDVSSTVTAQVLSCGDLTGETPTKYTIRAMFAWGFMPCKRDILLKLKLSKSRKTIFGVGNPPKQTEYHEYAIHFPLLPWPHNGQEQQSFGSFNFTDAIAACKDNPPPSEELGVWSIKDLVALTWCSDLAWVGQRVHDLKSPYSYEQLLGKRKSMPSQAIDMFLSATSQPGSVRLLIPKIVLRPGEIAYLRYCAEVMDFLSSHREK